MKKNLTTEIIKTGVLAGSLDILFAFVNAWWSVALKGMLILMIAIGLPVAHFAGRYWKKSHYSER